MNEHTTAYSQKRRSKKWPATRTDVVHRLNMNEETIAYSRKRRSEKWPAARKDTVHLFLQRSASHVHQNEEPRKVEDMELMMGVPKIVWVILADVLAVAAFLACIPFMMFLSKQSKDDG